MLKKWKQLVMGFIGVCILACCLISQTIGVSAMSKDTFNAKVAQFQSAVPEGHAHHNAAFTVNGVTVGWQCFGFANLMAFNIFGSYPTVRSSAEGVNGGWTIIRASASNSQVDTIKLGDIVRFRNGNTYDHSIVITDIVGDTFYYADCNGNGDDVVHYNRRITKATLAGKMTQQLHDNPGYYGWIAHHQDTVTTDTEKPKISNITCEARNVTSMGFRLYCTVSDNVGVESVKFATWHEGQNGSDAIWYDGSISGNTASAFIHTENFGYFLGRYTTHIYVYDQTGNYEVGGIDVELTPETLNTQNQKTVMDDTYTLKNAVGLYLDLNGAVDENGNPIIQYEFNGTNAQKFKVEYIGSGKYYLSPGASSAGRVVDVHRNGNNYSDPIEHGGKIDLWDKNDPEAQEFYLVPYGDGSYAIELASKNNYLIGGYDNYMGSGLFLQPAIKNSPSQHWYFCDENGNVIDPTPAIEVEKITLDRTNLTLTKENQTAKLNATVSPSNAENTSIEWKSSQPNVASVDGNGTVTAHANGTATITATSVSGGKQATCQVTVKIPAPVEETIFDDVSKSDWFYEAVKYGVDNGLFTGLTERTFAPNETLTRGMLVTILWRLDGKPESNQTIHFSDVPASEYFYKAVRWAVQQGVTNGYEDGRFGPNDPVTREQIVVMMYRYAKKNGNAGSLEADLSSFEDREQISGYAEEAVKWALANGIMNGKESNGKNLLDPKGSATRAEAAQLVMKFSKKYN